MNATELLKMYRGYLDSEGKSLGYNVDFARTQLARIPTGTSGSQIVKIVNKSSQRSAAMTFRLFLLTLPGSFVLTNDVLRSDHEHSLTIIYQDDLAGRGVAIDKVLHYYSVNRFLSAINNKKPMDQLRFLSKADANNRYAKGIHEFLKWAKDDELYLEFFTDNGYSYEALLELFHYEGPQKRKYIFLDDTQYASIYNTEDIEEKVILILAYEYGLLWKDLDSIIAKDYNADSGKLGEISLSREHSAVISQYYEQKSPLPRRPLFTRSKELIQKYSNRAVERLGITENDLRANPLRKLVSDYKQAVEDVNETPKEI